MIVPTNTRTTPQSPGTIMSDVVRPGLYRTLTVGDADRAAPAGDTECFGNAFSCASRLASAASAVLAAKSWLPST